MKIGTSTDEVISCCKSVSEEHFDTSVRILKRLVYILMTELSGIIEMWDYKQFLFKEKKVSSLKDILLRVAIKVQAFLCLPVS